MVDILNEELREMFLSTHSRATLKAAERRVFKWGDLGQLLLDFSKTHFYLSDGKGFFIR